MFKNVKAFKNFSGSFLSKTMYSDVYPKKLFKKSPEENVGRRLNPPRVTLPLSFRRASGRGPKRALESPGASCNFEKTML